MSSGNNEWVVLSFRAIAERDETYVVVNAFGTRQFTRKVGDFATEDLVAKRAK